MNREQLYNKQRDNKVYYVDIDGTITVEVDGWDYANRTPNESVITKLRKIHEEGTMIILWTARLHVDADVTESWLDKHNVPYDGLIFNKPYWDLYICDKATHVDHWVNEK